METHTPFSQTRRFWDRLGYSVVHIVEARGHAGGIWWMSNNSDVRYSVIDSCDQAITCKLVMGGYEWWCSAIYASPIPTVRDQFWEYLGNARNLGLGC